MPLYTIIMDYRGGTYIDQVRANSPKRAATRWAAALDTGPIFGMGSSAQAQVIDGLKDDSLVPLEGLERVWCRSVLVHDDIALINIIETADTSRR